MSAQIEINSNIIKYIASNGYRSNPIIDEEDISQLKHQAPQQYKLQQIIWDSKRPVRVGSLSDQTSNPLNVCRILEQKGFVDLFQETSLPDVTGFTFSPIK